MVGSTATHEIAFVNLGRAGEILRNRLGRDVLDFDAVFLEFIDKRFEAAQIARENSFAFFGKKGNSSNRAISNSRKL